MACPPGVIMPPSSFHGRFHGASGECGRRIEPGCRCAINCTASMAFREPGPPFSCLFLCASWILSRH